MKTYSLENIGKYGIVRKLNNPPSKRQSNKQSRPAVDFISRVDSNR